VLSVLQCNCAVLLIDLSIVLLEELVSKHQGSAVDLGKHRRELFVGYDIEPPCDGVDFYAHCTRDHLADLCSLAVL